MKSSTLFLWEKSLYLPGPNGWERLVVARPEDTALLLSQRLKPGSSVRMIYESAALHTEGRWVLALVMMRAATSRSAAASTYTWQLPSPSIT